MNQERLTQATSRFRRLLKLYPASYREKFGAEMTQVFRDMYRDEMASGTHPVEFWTKTYIDIGVNAMKQSLKPTARGNEDTIQRTIGIMSKVALGLIAITIWLAAAIALDALVVRHVINSMPPETLFRGSQWLVDQIYPVMYVANAAFWLCLIPLFWIRKQKRAWSTQALASGLALIIAPLLIPMSLFGYNDYDYATSVFSSQPVIAAVLALVLLAIGVRTAVAAQAKRLSFLQALRQRSILLLPLVIALASFVTMLLAKPVDETVTAQFWHLFLQGELSVGIFIAVLLFSLLLSPVTRQRAAYFTGTTLIVLTMAMMGTARIAHNSTCAQLTNNLTILYQAQASSTKSAQPPARAAEITKEIQRNCDSSYIRSYIPPQPNH